MSAPSDRVPVALTDADIERVDGVHGPATGVPFLLIKGRDRDLVETVAAALATVKPVSPKAPAGQSERERLAAYVHGAQYPSQPRRSAS